MQFYALSIFQNTFDKLTYAQITTYFTNKIISLTHL
jgi:hypothetical protein